MNSILCLENVTIAYGEIEAIKNVSFEVFENEIISFIGANGAGKSTLLKAISGLLPLKSGRITYKGITIRSVDSNLPAHKIVEMGIAMVPEGRRIFGELTVLENLEMGAYLVKDKEKVKRRLELIFSLFPVLKDRFKQKASLLSGGEQQMLAISRALMSFPSLLLLDEPSLGLAPMVIKEIFKILEKINREEKVTICLVEQNARLALKFSNKGYVIETGKIVIGDESKKLLEDPRVKASYLGEN